MNKIKTQAHTINTQYYEIIGQATIAELVVLERFALALFSATGHCCRAS